MELLGVIVVILLIGIWYGMYDISFSFASSVKSGAIRFNALIGILLGSVCFGYLFIYGNFYDGGYSDYWNIPSTLIAFIIVLSASLALIILKKASPINSICYTLLGSIWGWQLYNNTVVPSSVIATIVLGLLAPLLGAAIALVIFSFIRNIIRKGDYHLLHLSILLRLGIILALILAGIALSVNSIPVFLAIILPLGGESIFDLTAFSISNQSLLSVLIILLMFVAIYFSSRKRVEYWGKRGLTMGLEPVLAVLLSISIILFIFSSPWLYRLLGINLIPISPVAVSIGAFIGIGMVRKNREIEFKILLQAGASIFITPVLALVICYGIFNFLISPELVSTSIPTAPIDDQMINLKAPLIICLSLLALALVVISFQRQSFQRRRAQEALKREQQERFVTQQNLMGMELKAIQLENQSMNQKMEVRRQELVSLALNINEQRLFFTAIDEDIKKIGKLKDIEETKRKLTELRKIISSQMTFSTEMSGFYSEVENLHKYFLSNLMERFPELTEQERRLATLLRLGFSTKEIAGLVNITSKSVEVNRYRLRKSLGMKREENLVEFIKHI